MNAQNHSHDPAYVADALPGFGFTLCGVADYSGELDANGKPKLKLAVKRITPTATITYDKVTNWFFQQAHFGTPGALRDYFETNLLGWPSLMIVRGDPAPGLDLSKAHQRLSAEKHGLNRTIVPVARYYLVFDCDDVEVTFGDGAGDRLYEAALQVREKLGGPYRNVRMVAVASASTGLKGPTTARLRLIVLLDAPITDDEAKLYLLGLKADLPWIDWRVALTGQAIYTGRPVFEGGAVDPLPVNKRAFVLPGACNRAHIDIKPFVKKAEKVERYDAKLRQSVGKDWRKYLEMQLGGPLGFCGPLQSAMGIAAKSSETDDEIVAWTLALIAKKADPGRIAQYSAAWLREALTSFRDADAARAKEEADKAEKARYEGLTDDEAAELRAIVEGEGTDVGTRLMYRVNDWRKTMTPGAITKKFARFIVRLPIDELDAGPFAGQLATMIGVPKAEVMKRIKAERAEIAKRKMEEDRTSAQARGEVIVTGNVSDDAEQFVATRHTLMGGERTLHSYSGLYYAYADGRYRAMEPGSADKPGELESEVYAYFARALYPKEVKGVDVLVRYPTTKPKMGDMAANISTQIRLSTAAYHMPCWLESAPATAPDPNEVIAFSNGLLHWPTGKLLPHSPHFFSTNVLPYDYDPTATCPTFDQFMSDLFDTPPSWQAALEFMGLCLTPITGFQIMLWLMGDPGSGKGTLTRLIEQLMGQENVFDTSLDNLAGTFGLAGAVGKTLVAVTEARASAKFTDLTPALAKILAHVGEDNQAIPRKNIADYVGGLFAKWLLICNDPPKFTDPTGALLRRLLVLKTVGAPEKSDKDLGAKLAAELPGIAVKAIAALKRLDARGHFIQPEEGKAAMQEVEHTLDHVAAFMDKDCVVGVAESCARSELQQAYKAFCFQIGLKYPINDEKLGIHIAARLRRRGVKPKTSSGERLQGGGREKIVHGIRPMTAVEKGESDARADDPAPFKTG